ncbi:MAG: MBL fold metallo-hydrolase [Myxococcota bacterium]
MSSSRRHLWPTLFSLCGVLLAVGQRGCASDRIARHPFTPPPARTDAGHARICPLVVATEEVHAPGLVGGGSGSVSPVNAFLVEARGVLFLVDAGLLPEERAPALAQPTMGVFTFDRHPRSALVSQLAEAGIRPEDVSFILLTHTHGDHAGELEDLPDVPVVVSPEEAAWLGGLGEGRVDLFTWRTVAGWEALAPRLRVLRWAEEPVGPLPRSADLFGDGTVLVLPTPGHTPGSLSVLLRTQAGRTLLLGDAALGGRAVRENLPKGPLGRLLDQDPDEATVTLGQLHVLSQGAPDWVVWGGHDLDVLPHRHRFVSCARALRGP